MMNINVNTYKIMLLHEESLNVTRQLYNDDEFWEQSRAAARRAAERFNETWPVISKNHHRFDFKLDIPDRFVFLRVVSVLEQIQKEELESYPDLIEEHPSWSPDLVSGIPCDQGTMGGVFEVDDRGSFDRIDEEDLETDVVIIDNYISEDSSHDEYEICEDVSYTRSICVLDADEDFDDVSEFVDAAVEFEGVVLRDMTLPHIDISLDEISPEGYKTFSSYISDKFLVPHYIDLGPVFAVYALHNVDKLYDQSYDLLFQAGRRFICGWYYSFCIPGKLDYDALLRLKILSSPANLALNFFRLGCTKWFPPKLDWRNLYSKMFLALCGLVVIQYPNLIPQLSAIFDIYSVGIYANPFLHYKSMTIDYFDVLMDSSFNKDVVIYYHKGSISIFNSSHTKGVENNCDIIAAEIFRKSAFYSDDTTMVFPMLQSVPRLLPYIENLDVDRGNIRDFVDVPSILLRTLPKFTFTHWHVSSGPPPLDYEELEAWAYSKREAYLFVTSLDSGCIDSNIDDRKILLGLVVTEGPEGKDSWTIVQRSYNSVVVALVVYGAVPFVVWPAIALGHLLL
jgi:hypothetical protein